MEKHVSVVMNIQRTNKFELTNNKIKKRFWCAAACDKDYNVVVIGGNSDTTTVSGAKTPVMEGESWRPGNAPDIVSAGTRQYSNNCDDMAVNMRSAATLAHGPYIFIAGGSGEAPDGSTVEIYDAINNQFKKPLDAVTGNIFFTAYSRNVGTLTDLGNGDVLLAGGYAPTGDSRGSGIGVVGGYRNMCPATAEVLRYAAGSNEMVRVKAPAMINPRYHHAATLLADGNVLLTGGRWEFDMSSNDLHLPAELYDVQHDVFVAQQNLQEQRTCHTATLLEDGRVLIAGGYFYEAKKRQVRQTAEIYDPLTGIFHSVSHPMTQPRALHTATLLKTGQVLLTGGGAFDTPGSDTAEVFVQDKNNPNDGHFEAVTQPMVVARIRHSATFRPITTNLTKGKTTWTDKQRAEHGWVYIVGGDCEYGEIFKQPLVGARVKGTYCEGPAIRK